MAAINPAWGSGAPPLRFETIGARTGRITNMRPIGPSGVENPPSPPVQTPPAGTPPPATYTELPASGNIPPSTSPYAVDNPYTGDVVDPTATQSIVTSLTSWIQQNPLLTLGLAAAAVFLLMEMFGSGSHRSHHRRY